MKQSTHTHKRWLYSVLMVIFLLPMISFSQNNFYYYFDQKIYLDPVPNKYTVEFINTVDESVFTANNFDNIHLKNKIYEVSGDYFSLLNASNGAYNINQLYKYKGENANVLNEITLLFKEETTPTQIQNIEAQYGLIKTVECSVMNAYKVNNPITVANEIFETGFVIYSQPTFLVNLELHNFTPNDDYYNMQYYLNNKGTNGEPDSNGKYGAIDADIDAPEAWGITMGNPNIVIAVIDEGVTSEHPDLPASRIVIADLSNFDDGDGQASNDPSPDGDGNHGNAIAGIIAATADNGFGIAGIAPECKIMPMKIDIATQNLNPIILAINIAAEEGANIISGSWGVNSENPIPNAGLTFAIQHAIIFDNVSFVFSIGNNGTGDNFVAYPANLDEEDFPTSYPGMDIIAVGASDRVDLKATYSPVDAEVDICAPSNTSSYCYDNTEGGNIWTLDILGAHGYNPWNDQSPLSSCDDILIGQQIPSSGNNYMSYTGRMGGTSATAPQVAGVIALMKSLDVNTNCLTVPQINEILKVSADKVGGYDYSGNDGSNNGEFRPSGHSKELGYGRLNAYNALVMTQGFINTGKDLYIKDSPGDIGIEATVNPAPSPILPSLSDFQYDDPSRFALYLFDSPDIWVRNQADGMTIQTSEAIEYSPSNPAYVYVKVRTKGCVGSDQDEQLELYWAKTATIQTFPEYWDGSITSLVVTGGFINTKTITTELTSPFTPYQILEFEWYPPNPDDYDGIISYPWGFSLLARIIDDEDIITVPASQAGNVSGYVALNNNVASKSITVIDAGKPFTDIITQGAALMVNNPNNQSETYDLCFRNSIPFEEKSLLKEAEVQITLDDTLWSIWENGGFVNDNITICDDVNHIVLIDNEQGASLKNLEFASNETAFISTKINFLTKEVSNRENYDLFIVQKTAATQEIVGGSKIIVKKPPRPSFTADAGNNMEVSKNEPTLLNSNDIYEDAIYNWYDDQGNLVYTGQEYLLNPEVTKTYKLEIIAASDGYKDYDSVTVSIKLPEITSLSPNPANQSSNIVVNYKSENATSLYLVIMPLNGGFNDNFTMESNLSQITIPTNNYTTGLYFMSLVADGQVVDQKTFVIN